MCLGKSSIFIFQIIHNNSFRDNFRCLPNILILFPPLVFCTFVSPKDFCPLESKSINKLSKFLLYNFVSSIETFAKTLHIFLLLLHTIVYI